MHFKAPGYQHVYNPIIPYEGTIYGGLRKGMSLYFQGTIPQDIPLKRFHINLEGGGDIIFHFNPRFSPQEVIVFNTYQNGWQSEEKVKTPFHKGKSFQLVFIVTSEGYKLNVNGSQIHMYKHRIPLEKVRSLKIQGDIMMETVSIIGGVQEGIQAYPGQGEMVSIPYMGPIDGGLRTGMSVYFYGVVPHGAKRFHINLQVAEVKCCDKALHFNPRFRPSKMVVFNTFKNGTFEEPEKVQEMPFTTGERFELVFIISSEGYQVNVNAREFYMFKHRIPVEQVLALAVGGDVRIECISISGGSTEGEKGGGTGYNEGILPSIPYSSMIPGGMTEKKTFFIRGKVPPEARRFEINSVVSSSGDNAFHFNPRMYEASVVRNSWLGGTWGSEERDIDFNPFQEGQYFEIMMCCGKQKFEVFVNGKHMCDYVHRVKPFTLIDKLEIIGDVQLFYVEMLTSQSYTEILGAVQEGRLYCLATILGRCVEKWTSQCNLTAGLQICP